MEEEEERSVDLSEEDVLDEGFEESEPFSVEDLTYCDPKDHSIPVPSTRSTSLTRVQPDRSVSPSSLAFTAPSESVKISKPSSSPADSPSALGLSQVESPSEEAEDVSVRVRVFHTVKQVCVIKMCYCHTNLYKKLYFILYAYKLYYFYRNLLMHNTEQDLTRLTVWQIT